MGRRLNTTVLVGETVYEAGTDEADIDGAEGVTADVWDGETKAAADAPKRGGRRQAPADNES